MVKFNLKGIKGSLKGLGNSFKGAFKGIGSSFKGMLKKGEKLTFESIIEKAKKGEYRVIPTGRGEMVKVPQKEGKPAGPTLPSLEKAGERKAGKEVIKLEPTKKPEEHVLELMGKKEPAKVMLSPEKRQQFLNEIQTFIQAHGKELGPQKTVEEIKKRWAGAWSDLETRRKIAEMIRPTFTREEWKKPVKKATILPPAPPPSKEEVKKAVTLSQVSSEEEGRKKGGKFSDIVSNITGALKEKKCEWCKKPIPRGARVCPNCGKEQTIEEEQGIKKGVITGGIVSGILYLLSYLKFLPIPLNLYWLVGIFICCLLLGLKSNAAKAIGALGLMGIIGFYLISIPMVQALIPMRQINEVIYELNIKKDYVQCLMTHLTDVENIMAYGGLEALCKKILYEVKVVKKGCTECLALGVSTEVPLITPGSSFLFRLEYSMDEGADLPARNITTSFYVDDNETKEVTRCNEVSPCTLYPQDFEESSVKLKKEETQNFCSEDKNYIKYTVSTKYSYSTTGFGHFYITNNRRIYERRIATTSSGPLDVVVSSDSSYYRKDEDSTIFLTFVLINKGEGEIKLNSLKVVEFNPLNINLLEKALCDVRLIKENSVWNVDISEKPLNMSIKGGKKIMFGCSIPIEGVFGDLPGPLVTYTYEAIANYTYEKNQTGQVWIDRDYCEFYEEIEESQESTPPETGTGRRGGCLVEDSLILTPEGFKKIQELEEGDYVIGYKNGKKVSSKILEKSFHEGEFEVYFYKGYWFTGNHLVYLDDYKEFRRVDELSNIRMNFTGKIYNIQTETQNYFGKNGLLIHNK